MEKTVAKTLALLLALLVTGSIVAPSIPVALSVTPSIVEQEDEVEVEVWWKRLNITFEEALELAWIVRNETYDLFMWSDSYLSPRGIDIAKRILEKGDYFLELAINTSEVNETLATAYAFVAALYYGRAPVTAYIVLGITVSEGVVGRGVTREVVEVILARAIELKDLLDNAISIAKDYNITVPDTVFILREKALSELNLSKKLLDKGFTGPAFAAAVRGYHWLTRSYSMLIKATFADKLGLKPEGLTRTIMFRKTEVRERVERLLHRLPRHVREKIMEHMRGKEISPEAFRHAIKAIVKEHRKRLAYVSIKVTARIITGALLLLVATDPTGTGKVILEWMEARNLTKEVAERAPGRVPGKEHIPKIPDVRKLYLYIKNLVNATYHEYNVTGLALINKTLEILSNDIKNVTGVEINLVELFYTSIVVHVSIHHEHHRGRHRGP